MVPQTGLHILTASTFCPQLSLGPPLSSLTKSFLKTFTVITVIEDVLPREQRSVKFSSQRTATILGLRGHLNSAVMTPFCWLLIAWSQTTQNKHTGLWYHKASLVDNKI